MFFLMGITGDKKKIGPRSEKRHLVICPCSIKVKTLVMTSSLGKHRVSARFVPLLIVLA